MGNKKNKKIIDIIWPKAKKDLEKGLKETKNLIEKGEKRIINATDKGIRNIKVTISSFKKEKLYYEIGKVIAKTSPDKWSKSLKIKKILGKIKAINREIKLIKKEKR